MAANTLTLICKLYKPTKGTTFQKEPSKLSVKRVCKSGKHKSFGVVELNLAKYASLVDNQQRVATRLKKCSDKKAELKFTVQCRWLKKLTPEEAANDQKLGGLSDLSDSDEAEEEEKQTQEVKDSRADLSNRIAKLKQEIRRDRRPNAPIPENQTKNDSETSRELRSSSNSPAQSLSSSTDRAASGASPMHSVEKDEIRSNIDNQYDNSSHDANESSDKRGYSDPAAANGSHNAVDVPSRGRAVTAVSPSVRKIKRFLDTTLASSPLKSKSSFTDDPPKSRIYRSGAIDVLPGHKHNKPPSSPTIQKSLHETKPAPAPVLSFSGAFAVREVEELEDLVKSLEAELAEERARRLAAESRINNEELLSNGDPEEYLQTGAGPENLEADDFSGEQDHLTTGNIGDTSFSQGGHSFQDYGESKIETYAGNSDYADDCSVHDSGNEDNDLNSPSAKEKAESEYSEDLQHERVVQQLQAELIQMEQDRDNLFVKHVEAQTLLVEASEEVSQACALL